MPKNILIDLNVVLDVLLKRDGHAASQQILEQGEDGSRQLYLSAHAVTTFSYLLEQAHVPPAERTRQLDWVLRIFRIVPLDERLLKAALRSTVSDYEDAVVEQAALACGATAIITRNRKDFRSSAVPAISPDDYLVSGDVNFTP